MVQVEPSGSRLPTRTYLTPPSGACPGSTKVPALVRLRADGDGSDAVQSGRRPMHITFSPAKPGQSRASRMQLILLRLQSACRPLGFKLVQIESSGRPGTSTLTGARR